MSVVYAFIGLLIATTGLCVCRHPRVAEFYAVAMFVAATVLISSIFFEAAGP